MQSLPPFAPRTTTPLGQQAAMDPLMMSRFIDDPRLAEAADSVSASLQRVLAALESARG